MDGGGPIEQHTLPWNGYVEFDVISENLLISVITVCISLHATFMHILLY